MSESSPCTLWKGSVDPAGYGRYERVLAHRFVWALEHGPLPRGAGLDIHHTCGNRLCVNLDHLELVTHADHTRIHNGIAHHFRDREVCSKGHPYTSENTRIGSDGRRVCRSCKRIREGRSTLVPSILGESAA